MRFPKDCVVAGVTEVQGDKAVILVVVNAQEHFYVIVPLNFCPWRARTVGCSFKLTWNFSRTSTDSIGHVFSGELNEVERMRPEIAAMLHDLGTLMADARCC